MPKNNLNERIEKNLLKVKNRLLIFSGKGGVGKSTVSAGLSLVLSKKKIKTGLIDIDLHGPNLAKMLGVEKKTLEVSPEGANAVKVNKYLQLISISFLLSDPNTPIIWRGPMKIKAIKQFIGDINWGELEWLIIDSPPGTGDEPLSVAQIIPATGAIIVTTPQEVSLMDSKKAVVFAKKMNLNIIGIIENMSGFTCPHCNNNVDLFQKGGGLKISEELNVPFLGSIPMDPRVVKMGDEGQSFFLEYPDSEAGIKFHQIVDKIIHSNSK